MSNKGARLQALGWAHKLDTAEQIQADGPEFETWMAQSTEQDDAYHLAERARCHVELYRRAILEAGVFDEEMLLNRIKQHYAPPRGRKGLRIRVVVIALLVSLAHTEQLLWSHINTTVRQVNTVTLEQSPVVILDAEPMVEAVDEFNRYNQRKLVIDEHRLDAVPVVGRYDAYNPDVFADELRRTHHIEYTSTGTPGSNQGEIHLQPRSPRSPMSR